MNTPARDAHKDVQRALATSRGGPFAAVRKATLLCWPADENGRHFVRDRATGDCFELGAQERFLLSRLDGRHTSREIRAAFAERFTQPLSNAKLLEFVQLARERGLLQDSEPASTAEVAAAGASADGWSESPQTFNAISDEVVPALQEMRSQERANSSVQLRMLWRTAKYFEEFVHQSAGNGGSRAARVKAWSLLGQLYCELALVGRAERAYRKAIEIAGESINDDASPELLCAEAANRNHLTYLLANCGRIAEARQVGFEAHQQLNALLAEFGSKPRYQSVLSLEQATCRNNLAMLYLASGQPREASRYSVKARSIPRNPLDAEPPLPAPDGKTIRPDILTQGRLPAEFERHDALLLSFPQAQAEWWQPALVEIVQAVWRTIQVVLLVPDVAAQQLVCRTLARAGVPPERIRFCHVPTGSVWTRDYGPLVVQTTVDASLRPAVLSVPNVSSSPAACDDANGYVLCSRSRNAEHEVTAGDYAWVNAVYRQDFVADDHVAVALARAVGARSVRTLCHIAGGNLLTNGKGLCISTTELLRRNAELGFEEHQVTAFIKRLFGAEKVLYLEPLAGEPTGDVDWFATFVSPQTIVVGDYDERDPENAAILDRNAARLAEATTPAEPLRVVRIPMPPHGSDVFGGTYTNVVFANGMLLVPTWPDAPAGLQRQALDTYRRLLPAWNVVGIDAAEICLRKGALRCATMPIHRFPGGNRSAR